MFTGIVTHIAKIKEIREIDNAREIILAVNLPKEKLVIGQSISCDGMCLTVTKISENNLSFFISHESLDKTNAFSWRPGREINIEVAMTSKDFFAGHVVTGHIDNLVTVKNIIKESDSYILEISAAEKDLDFLIDKGSVTLNVVSLTVNKVFSDYFTVNIIPHSWQNTNLRNLKIGDRLNFEADIIAKYIKKYVKNVGRN